MYDTMKAEFEVLRRKIEVIGEVMKMSHVCDVVLESVPMLAALASSSSESVSGSEPVTVIVSTNVSTRVQTSISYNVFAILCFQ